VADALKELEDELVSYVGLDKRLGRAERLADILVAHRRQCLANLRDDESPTWAERIRLLDQLAATRSIRLEEEEQLRFILDEISERERARRAERIQEQRELTS
jgi:hypothetical protein